MNRNNKIYRKILIFATIFSLLFTIIYGSNQYINLYIPDEMKLIVDRDESFEFNVPIQAHFTSEKQGVLSINESNVPKDRINLSEPFSVRSSETGEISVQLKLFGIIPIKNVKVNVISQDELIPAGLTVGVVVSTNGVMVLGTGVVNGADGLNYEPAKGVLKTGDYIIKINDTKINSKEELVEHINIYGEKDITLTINRNGDIKNVNVTPIKSMGDNDYKLGIWVRDDTQGIGTITYIDEKDNRFGALGHGITDADTKQLISVADGEILETRITSITKGQRGFPGEISGVIIKDKENILGSVDKNTEYGIFGNVNEAIFNHIERKPLKIGLKHEIEVGQAFIRSFVDEEIKDYEIKITKVYLGNGDINKGMIIEVVDEGLLERTNGIVQGMSGSPIIQNDKIIGAVTHVFIQDSTRGYGTFIENMLRVAH
ncbi:stage IV sporulation protein B [Natranaerovirga pectinivora]|uniref:Stage IV sporulation protein B n=1 Tax=Natranaerovirga pectinivora TaxID=682400 RepID=A0A4R3MNY2_9FIRM|nr:SpoIVB peptidase [Natranaerovirga pectinivora]TCT16931.1 stage IV sporulation protein B [Natranaerovirga pectinivora]